MPDPWTNCVERLARAEPDSPVPWRAELCRRFFLSDSPGKDHDDSTGLVHVLASTDKESTRPGSRRPHRAR